jgi:hypothetical protein
MMALSISWVNQRLVQAGIPAAYLEEELCQRFGLCGEEYASIQREIETRGRVKIVLSLDEGPKLIR